eukprot:2960766-Pyramimonas_sp.AAC.1
MLLQMRTVDRRPLEVPIPDWLTEVKSRVERLGVMEGRPVDQVKQRHAFVGYRLSPRSSGSRCPSSGFRRTDREAIIDHRQMGGASLPNRVLLKTTT